MTINWFAPPDETGVIPPFLARKAKVIAWTHETKVPAAFEQGTGVSRYDLAAMPWAEINAAEISLYQIGPEVDSFGPIWQVARQHPGIVILRATNLQALFGGLTQRGVLSGSEYLEMMEFYHSEQGRQSGEAFLAAKNGSEEIGAECPLTGAALENALGVIAESEEDYNRITAISDLPVQRWSLSGNEDSNWNSLTTLFGAIDAAQSREAARRVAGQAGQAMKAWFTHQSARVLVPRLATTIGDLFDPADAASR